MFPQFPQTSHFPAYFHSSARKEREKSRRRGPQDGVQWVPGWLRRRWASLEEASGKPRGGWSLRPSSELIGTALLFYPPTKACSFRKAYYPPAEQLLQSRFTAAARGARTIPFLASRTSASLIYTQVSFLILCQRDLWNLRPHHWVSFMFMFFRTVILYFFIFFFFFFLFFWDAFPNVHILVRRMS